MIQLISNVYHKQRHYRNIFIEMQQDTKPDPKKEKATLENIGLSMISEKHKHQANGVSLFSPYELYEGQKKYASYIIQCLKNKQNALVQSPTGTGKTLSLLCSTLSWVYHEQSKGRKPQRIIYTSRTHAQLKQVVEELKKTGFKLKLCILGSRQQTCINENLALLKGEGKDLECRIRIMRQNNQFCKYFHHEEYFARIQDVGKIADIQEIRYLGKNEGFCPFFYERHAKQEANLILMPYTYLLDKKSSLSENMKDLVENSIIIFDEAHNIAGVCESSKEFTITRYNFSRALHQLNDLRQCKLREAVKIANKGVKNQEKVSNLLTIKTPLNELEKHASFVSLIHDNIDRMGISYPDGKTLTVPEFIKFFDKVTHQSQFGSLSSNFQKLLESAPLISNDIMYKPYWALEVWFALLAKLLAISSANGDEFGADYYKVHASHDGSNVIMSIMCLDPRVGFRGFLEMKPSSIILTSGTLSPLNCIPAQLGLEFARPLSCAHIMTKQQVNGCIITVGPKKTKLNFGFENRDQEKLYSDLGDVLLEIVSATAHGVIIFLPSFSLLMKVRVQFNRLGYISRLYSKKSIFFEESDSKQFKQVLQQYLEEAVKPKGAALFAVVRGKISEGLDFSGNKCRAVAMIGVPYPAFKDVKVVQKMEYLDKKSKQIKTLNGKEWYLCETVRSINQSIGRLIRNKNDYGSIYLIDERFTKNEIFSQISSWARQSIKVIEDFQQFKFKVKLFQNYFQKANKQSEQVEHFFVSQLGTKLTNGLNLNERAIKTSISMPKNEFHMKAIAPEKQLVDLKEQIKRQLKQDQAKRIETQIQKQDQKQKEVPVKKQRIIFCNRPAKSMAPVPELRECPICRMERRLIKNTECIHEICEECWDIWLKKDLRCPVCRVRVRQKYLIKS